MAYVYRLIKTTLLLTALTLSACDVFDDDFDGSMMGCSGVDARDITSGGCSGPGYDIMLDLDVNEDEGSV